MMTKKKVLIIAGGVGVSLVALVSILLIRPRQTSIVSPVQPPSLTQEKAPQKLITYKDEAGFEFKYPESLVVKDVSADLPVYSSLEILKAFSSDKMVIKVTDTNFTSLDAWLKSKEASGAGASREITLAGMPGSQIQFDNPRKLVTVVISDGIMYFLESPLDEENYWNKIHNDIVSSFTLGETQAPAAQAGGEEVIYEEEEVIE